MPQWLLSLLIKLALSVGLPAAMKYVPGISGEVWKIIEEILRHILEAEDKPQAVRNLRAKVKECTGAGCPVDLKGE